MSRAVDAYDEKTEEGGSGKEGCERGVAEDGEGANENQVWRYV